MNYYNEHDPKAAAWLRHLIAEGEIPMGVVDTRSIIDVQPHELHGYTQCHFFAGIGGWSYALRLAEWSEDKPCGTGSCPCQPFSSAGKGLGVADARHLWPVFCELIRCCREFGQPWTATIFGEQVASKAGREWLAGVFADLEAMGYSRAGADLCAAGVSAPHIRQRLYWMAYADERVSDRRARGREQPLHHEVAGVDRLEHAPSDGWQQRRTESGGRSITGRCESGGLADPLGERGCSRQSGCPEASHAGFAVKTDAEEREFWLGNSDQPRPQRRRFNADEYPHQWPPWSTSEFIDCTDGRSRRVESGTFPLAHGVPARVGLLRGYGNAIVPQVAAEFIQAGEEARQCFHLIG